MHMQSHTVQAIFSIIGVIILFIVIVSLIIRQPLKTTNVRKPKYKAKILLTPPEQTLYARLVNALPDYEIFAQVQLSRVLEGIKENGKKRGFNHISQKSLDFVVCRKDFSILAAIELDDKSHNAINRQKSDRDKDSYLTSANIPIIRWTVKGMPSENDILLKIRELRLR